MSILCAGATGRRALPFGLFEARTLFWIGRKQCFRAEDACALSQKKSAQLRREKRRSVAARIEIQEQAAIRRKKSRANVVNKKFPVCRLPLVPVIVRRAIYAVKANAMRGHEVKLFSEIGQGDSRMDF